MKDRLILAIRFWGRNKNGSIKCRTKTTTKRKKNHQHGKGQLCLKKGTSMLVKATPMLYEQGPLLCLGHSIYHRLSREQKRNQELFDY